MKYNYKQRGKVTRLLKLNWCYMSPILIPIVGGNKRRIYLKRVRNANKGKMVDVQLSLEAKFNINKVDRNKRRDLLKTTKQILKLI